jgi:hypothetical protein
MEMRHEENIVAWVFRDKLSESQTQQQQECSTGDDPQDQQVNPTGPTSQRPFSLVLQFLRIFLLIYHSVKWDEVMQTTGQSKFDDLDLCD